MLFHAMPCGSGPHDPCAASPCPARSSCHHSSRHIVEFILENALLIAVAVVSGGMLLWPMIRGGAAGSAVGTAEAVRLINREKGVLVDVGEPGEYAAGHAANSRNIPFGQIETSKDLPSNKALPLLLLCPSGARANRAAALLRRQGYAQARAVSGGNRAWREAGLPMEKAAPAAEEPAKPVKAGKASKSA
jgi:rhodanese-related sulfurtransferase